MKTAHASIRIALLGALVAAFSAYCSGMDDSTPSSPEAVSSTQSLTPPPVSDWDGACGDVDRDGWPACSSPQAFQTDCDDADRSVFPGATELCNAIDDDCDGEIDEYITNCETATIPGDPPAHLGDEHAGSSEEDDDDEGRPPSPDLWPDACVDLDQDFWPVCPTPQSYPNDCDDADRFVFPGATELCNAIDDDCDGEIDEDITHCDP